MKYNHYFANHFGSCRVLCTGRDEHRQRDVRVFMLPGEFDVVGISDGVDAWIAPANTLESSLIRQAVTLMGEIRNGSDAAPVVARVRLKPEVTITEPPGGRRVLTTTQEDDQPLPRRRILDV